LVAAGEAAGEALPDGCRAVDAAALERYWWAAILEKEVAKNEAEEEAVSWHIPAGIPAGIVVHVLVSCGGPSPIVSLVKFGPL
jgi:hypothetical protein